MAKEGPNDGYLIEWYIQLVVPTNMLCLMYPKLVFSLVPTATVKKKYSHTSTSSTCLHGTERNNSAFTLYSDMSIGWSKSQRIEISSFSWTQQSRFYSFHKLTDESVKIFFNDKMMHTKTVVSTVMINWDQQNYHKYQIQFSM